MGLFGSSRTDPYQDIDEHIGEFVKEAEELEGIDRSEVQEVDSSEVREKFQEEGRGIEQLVKDIKKLKADEGNDDFLRDLMSLLDELAEVIRLHYLMIENVEVPEYRSYEEKGDQANINRKGEEIEGKLIVMESMTKAALNVCQDAEAIAESHGDEELHNAVGKRVERFENVIQAIEDLEK
ncbi:MAG: hypothetical protein ABEJ99_02350 [Candidatus Nanohaloarchaea archaeon]